MNNVITRYDIQLNSENEKINLDFVLDSTEKKIIHGTVWNNDLTNPKRESEALVILFKPGKDYENDPLDISYIGFALTDMRGEFFAGPFDTSATIIFKLVKNNKHTENIDLANSFKISE